MSFNWKRLSRRQFAAIMAILALIPMFLPVKFPMRIGSLTQDFYNEVESLEEGDVVMWAAAYEQGHHQRTYTLFKSILWQVCDQNAKLVLISFTVTAPETLRDLQRIINLEGKYGYVYGEDYVILPYYGSEEVALKTVGNDLHVYKEDIFGNDIDSLPLMDQLHTLNDIDLVIQYPQAFTFPEAVFRQWPLINPDLRLLEARAYSLVAPWYDIYVFGALDGARGGAEYQYLTYAGEELIKINGRNLVTLWLFVAVILTNVIKQERSE